MPADPRQLRLFLSPAEITEAIAELVDGDALADELTVVRSSLMAEVGLADSSAATELRHLVAMVRETDHRTVRGFLGDPEAVISAIRSPERRSVRRDRFRAAEDALDAGLLPEAVAEATRSSVLGALPGRPAPRPGLLDVDLGGSEKEVRVRVLPSWEDVEAMIAAMQPDRDDLASVRNAALVAIHGRSTLPPQTILGLDWGDVPDLRANSGGSAATLGLALPYRGRACRFEVHETGIDWLRRLWRAEGAPTDAPVFCSIRRPRMRLASNTAGEIIRGAARAIGFTTLDRCHLRGGFVWSLKQQGWSDLRLLDALGYLRMRELRKLLQPLEEAAAQTIASEFLSVSHPASPIPTAPPPRSRQPL